MAPCPTKVTDLEVNAALSYTIFKGYSNFKPEHKLYFYVQLKILLFDIHLINIYIYIFKFLPI